MRYVKKSNANKLLLSAMRKNEQKTFILKAPNLEISNIEDQKSLGTLT